VRCGHARSRDGVVAAALPRRQDAHPGRCDRMIGIRARCDGEVAEIRRRVVAIGAARRGCPTAGLAVEVCDGRYRQHFVVSGRNEVGEVCGVVACSDRVGHASGNRIADRQVQRVAGRVAAIAVGWWA